MQEFLDHLAEPVVWEWIFAIADALIGGHPVAVSAGGGAVAIPTLTFDGTAADRMRRKKRIGEGV